MEGEAVRNETGDIMSKEADEGGFFLLIEDVSDERCLTTYNAASQMNAKSYQSSWAHKFYLKSPKNLPLQVG